MPAPSRCFWMEGLEKMLPPFPRLGYPWRIAPGRSVSKGCCWYWFSSVAPAPVRRHGTEAAGLLTFPPLIHFFFGQQGGAGFFALVDEHMVDNGPF